MRVNLQSPADYPAKEAAAVRQFNALRAAGRPIALKKRVRHTFKRRDDKPNLDLRPFNRVIAIDTEQRLATVEGFTTFYDLVRQSLPLGLMPQAVPELRSITIGGAIAGLGGQSSSFRYGLIHEMVTHFDLLGGEGRMLRCSPEENEELFAMLPNSYGSLGYVLRCDIRLNPVAPFVRLELARFAGRDAFFQGMEQVVRAQTADFVEGVSFGTQQYVLASGVFAQEARPGERPFRPAHTPFFQLLRDTPATSALLTTRDYIWRWDPDAFWSTDQPNLFGAILLYPSFRKSFGPAILRSDRLIAIGKLRNRLRRSGRASLLFQEAARREALIQDAAIPFARAAEFDRWLARELRIYPLWYCPVRTMRPPGAYPLYNPGVEFVVDFGFYCSIDLEPEMEAYHYNRRIEQQLLQVGGLKCLYSDTFFPRELFWRIYDREAYAAVKAKYDPQGTFQDLYDKVVNAR